MIQLYKKGKFTCDGENSFSQSCNLEILDKNVTPLKLIETVNSIEYNLDTVGICIYLNGAKRDAFYVNPSHLDKLSQYKLNLLNNSKLIQAKLTEIAGGARHNLHISINHIKS